MLRTSYSQILNSSRDFSTALVRRRGPADRPGRARADPCRRAALGGQGGARRLPRHASGRATSSCSTTPITAATTCPTSPPSCRCSTATRLAFWSINRSHQSDIGGATHGAYNPGATEIWQEGIRIPPLKLYDRGELRADVLEMIVAQRAPPARLPRRPRGDDRLGAGRRAAHAGAARGVRLGDHARRDRGGARRRRAPGARGDRRAGRTASTTARRCSTTTATAPRTSTSAPRSPSAAATSRSTCRTRDPQVTGFVNSSYPNMRSAVVVALAYLIDPRDAQERRRLPAARGDRARRARWSGRSPARRSRSAPTTAARRSSRRSSRRWRRPARSARWRAGAGASASRSRARTRAAASRSSGTCSRRGPGGGASPAGDGWPAAGEWQAAGGIKFGSLEVAEVRFPLFFRRHEFRPGQRRRRPLSRRPGRRARDGRSRSPSPRSPTPRATACATAPAACSAARTAQPHRYVLHSEGRPDRPLKTKEVGIAIRPGDVLDVRSGGGGGCGDPAGRTADERARATAGSASSPRRAG